MYALFLTYNIIMIFILIRNYFPERRGQSSSNLRRLDALDIIMHDLYCQIPSNRGSNSENICLTNCTSNPTSTSTAQNRKNPEEVKGWRLQWSYPTILDSTTALGRPLNACTKLSRQEIPFQIDELHLKTLKSSSSKKFSSVSLYAGRSSPIRTVRRVIIP